MNPNDNNVAKIVIDQIERTLDTGEFPDPGNKRSKGGGRHCPSCEPCAVKNKKSGGASLWQQFVSDVCLPNWKSMPEDSRPPWTDHMKKCGEQWDKKKATGGVSKKDTLNRPNLVIKNLRADLIKQTKLLDSREERRFESMPRLRKGIPPNPQQTIEDLSADITRTKAAVAAKELPREEVKILTVKDIPKILKEGEKKDDPEALKKVLKKLLSEGEKKKSGGKKKRKDPNCGTFLQNCSELHKKPQYKDIPWKDFIKECSGKLNCIPNGL